MGAGVHTLSVSNIHITLSVTPVSGTKSLWFVLTGPNPSSDVHAPTDHPTMNRSVTLPRLVAFAVFVVSIVSLTALWGIFWTMWVRGETSIILEADHFSEFLPEFTLLTLAIVFLPVLLYELDRLLVDQSS